MVENEISSIVIRSAIKVHRRLGPGLLESAYQECLYYELVQSGLLVDKQMALPLVYDEVKMECGYRIDLFVEKKVIVEIKSLDTLADIHTAQVLTYLRLSDCHLGLLINFNVVLLKDGIRRIVNNLSE